MEDPAGRQFEPAQLAALARQEPDAGGVGLVPRVRELAALLRVGHAERDRQVVDDHEPLGDREVVHHGRVGDRDVPDLRHRALGVEDDVLVVVPAEEVGQRVQLAADRVEVGVGGEPAGQAAVEVAGADGVELVAQLVRQRPRLHGRERAPGQPDDVGVGREVHVAVHGPRPGGLAEPPGDRGAAHPPVAVPLGAPVAQPHAVDHALAEEQVPGGGVVEAERVGAVTQISAVELGRDAPGDLQVERGDLLGHRGESVLEGSGRHDASFSAEARNGVSTEAHSSR